MSIYRSLHTMAFGTAYLIVYANFRSLSSFKRSLGDVNIEDSLSTL